MGLDYVDIFYSHRSDPDTPLEETMGALDTRGAPGQGALRRHLVLLAGATPRRRRAILRDLGTPLLIHQPSYSMLNRWIEDGLLDVLEQEGIGCIAFSPLAQGMLTDRYLDGDPRGLARDRGRLPVGRDCSPTENSTRCAPSTTSPSERGQSLAQMALAWTLRDPRMTSTLIGASSVAQLEENVGGARPPRLHADELAEIDQYAPDSGINLWAPPSAH